jgi:thiamine biosynthesis lipoprotein
MDNMTSPTGQESLYSFRFSAMNTTIDCSLQCAPERSGELEDLARSWFDRTEKRFSRFRPDSELSHLNRLAGERCMVSRAMLEVLMLAETYRRLTEGVFDPYVLEALLAAGYDETFEAVKRRPAEQFEPQAAHPEPKPRIPVPPMEIDPGMNSLRLPPSAAVDLGGIVKSWSARRLAGYFRARMGVRRGLINAGGDLTVWGRPEGGTPPWRIAVENPWTDTAKAGVLVLHEGAAATSGTLGRRWMSGRGPMHHLIDPSTMRPGDSDIVQCTVSGTDGVECEIWSKTICIAGSSRGLQLLAAKGNPDNEALLFTKDRRTLFYGKEASLGLKWKDVSVDALIPKPDNFCHDGGE